MDQWTVDEECKFLVESEIAQSVVTQFEVHAIDGYALHTVSTATDLQNRVPNLTSPIADCKTCRDIYLKNNVQQLFSEVRSFKSSSAHVKYTESSILVENGNKVEESGPDYNNILYPAREFKTNIEFDLTFFISETFRFATACMNSRANGVIYFGIKDKTSVIVGCKVNISQHELQDKLNEKINSCFDLPVTQGIVHHCLSSVKYLNVYSHQMLRSDLIVIEVEVEPKYEYIDGRYFKVNLYKLSKSEKKLSKGKVGQLFIREGSSSKELMKDSEEQKVFISKILPQISKFRKTADKPDIQKHEFKSEALKNLLLRKRITDKSSFSVLIIDKPLDDMDAKKKKVPTVITFLKWRVVIDLDSIGVFNEKSRSEIHHTTSMSPETLADGLTILNRLEHNSTTCWIYANGSEKCPKDTYDSKNWQDKRKSEIISKIVKNISIITPIRRALVACLFFSDKDGIMSDICREFVEPGFAEKILYISEHERSIDLLKEKIPADKMQHDTHGIVGLPWVHVAGTFRAVSGKMNTNCVVPTSSSSLIPVRKSLFPDLEILCSNECKDIHSISPDNLTDMRSKFLQGNPVQWENIASGHIVKREKCDVLQHIVNKSLSNSRPTERCSVVTVYYQPGSGASTLARHVLWNFRKNYKCAVVTSINPTTREQVINLYLHGEEKVSDEKRKPVLILLDFSDESHFSECKSFLSNLLYTGQNSTIEFFCVIIWCTKVMKIPDFEPHRCISLDQYFSEADKQGFSNLLTHSSLTKEDRNPDFMLAFLIFKNELQTDYIKNCVIKKYVFEYLSELSDWEEPILKYIGLFNTYSEESSEIPIAFFDTLVPVNLKVDYKCWLELSETFKLFCLQVSKCTLGTVKSFKIVHPLLAKEILHQLMEKRKQKLSETVIELIKSDLFRSKQSHSRNGVLEMTRNMLTRRKKTEDGDISTKFSALISTIFVKESSNDAIKVMQTAYEVLLRDDERQSIWPISCSAYSKIMYSKGH